MQGIIHHLLGKTEKTAKNLSYNNRLPPNQQSNTGLTEYEGGMLTI
jgi:hypothetical protein